MTLHPHRLPFALDPLVAEAKRRMRRRRFVAGLALVATASVAVAVTLCLRPGQPSGGSVSRRPAAVPNAVVYAGVPKPRTVSPLEASRPIWRARLDGSHAVRLTMGHDPAVSPDGRWVTFSRGAHLLLMPAAGGPAKVVYTFTGKWADAGTNGDTPTWAPDSRHLAFLGLSVGWVILDRLSRQHGVLLQGAGDVAFSPSSQKIVYSMRDREGFDLYERSVLGGTPVRLTHDGKSGSPAWGKLGIAFTREYVGPGGHLHGGIWLRDARTHRIRQLYTGASTYPAFFSANGNELLARSVYPAALGCCERLWAIDVATGVKRPLTPRWSDVSPLGMSADGSTVLAGIGCNGPKRSGYTETIPFAGGKPHVILRGPRDRGPCQASWNR